MKLFPSNRLFRAAASGAATVLLGLALALPAQAQNVCTTKASLVNPMTVDIPGTGGTGAPVKGLINAVKEVWRSALSLVGVRTAEDPGGIGGTGVTAQGEKRLGGTGIIVGDPGTGGGIGGTGIVGVITGFASICVNDVEVHFDANTPVFDDGRPTSARQLAVGQVVAVRAAGVGAEVSARNIALIHAAVGPVDAINPATGEFSLLGQTARALTPGDLARLKVGDWVRVSGHRLAQGQIAASHIEPVASQPEAHLNGLVSQSDSAGFMVNGTRVQLDSQKSTVPPRIGQEVLAIGTWDGSRLRAQLVQVEPTRSSLGQVGQVVMEGYVKSLGDRLLDLGRGVLNLSADVQYVGGVQAQLTVDQRVRVTGRVGVDQRVQVDRVEFKNNRSGSDGQSGSSRRRSDSSGENEPNDDTGSSGKSGGSGKSGSSESSSSRSGSSEKSSGSEGSDSGK